MNLPLTDEDLIAAMFDRNLVVAQAARLVYDRRHATEPKPTEPPHCSECFEGCPKCQK